MGYLETVMQGGGQARLRSRVEDGEESEAAAVVRRAQAGDVDAQNRVFRTWLPVVLRWCARLGGPRVDPEDAAHDVFVVVMRRLGDVERPDRFSSWLYGITRRVLRQHRRKVWLTRWLPEREVDEEPAEDGTGCGETWAAANELSRQVQGLLEALPAPQREVLVLCVLEDRTVDEVSTLLGIPRGTVSSRLRLARDKLGRLAKARRLDQHFVPTEGRA